MQNLAFDQTAAKQCYRRTQYLVGIMGAFEFLLLLFFLRESYPPVSLSALSHRKNHNNKGCSCQQSRSFASAYLELGYSCKTRRNRGAFSGALGKKSQSSSSYAFHRTHCRSHIRVRITFKLFVALADLS